MNCILHEGNSKAESSRVKEPLISKAQAPFVFSLMRGILIKP